MKNRIAAQHQLNKPLYQERILPRGTKLLQDHLWHKVQHRYFFEPKAEHQIHIHLEEQSLNRLHFEPQRHFQVASALPLYLLAQKTLHHTHNPLKS